MPSSAMNSRTPAYVWFSVGLRGFLRWKVQGLSMSSDAARSALFPCPTSRLLTEFDKSRRRHDDYACQWNAHRDSLLPTLASIHKLRALMAMLHRRHRVSLEVVIVGADISRCNVSSERRTTLMAWLRTCYRLRAGRGILQAGEEGR